MKATHPRSGSSRIGVIVAIASCGIFVGLAVVLVQSARETAARVKNQENMAHVAKAVLLTHDQYHKFPPYFGVYGDQTEPAVFHLHIMPFVEPYNQYAFPDNNALIPSYLSSSDPTQTHHGWGAVNFVVNMRLYYAQGGVGELATEGKLLYPKLPSNIPDGVSNTLLLATEYMHCGKNGGSMWMDPGKNAPGSPTAATFGVSMQLWQQAPTQADCDPLAGTAVSFTKQSIQIALCDASVRSVAVGVRQAAWQALHTPGADDGYHLGDGSMKQ